MDYEGAAWVCLGVAFVLGSLVREEDVYWSYERYNGWFEGLSGLEVCQGLLFGKTFA